MPDTVFSKIIAGEIPCHRVYEDDHVLAFLDIGPLGRGHTLVIPKEPAERLEDLSDDAAAALGRVLPSITRAVLAATGAPACNVLQNNGREAGQEVMHVHFHIIPCDPDHPESPGLLKQWTPGTPPDDAPELAADIAAKIASAINP